MLFILTVEKDIVSMLINCKRRAVLIKIPHLPVETSRISMVRRFFRKIPCKEIMILCGRKLLISGTYIVCILGNSTY